MKKLFLQSIFLSLLLVLSTTINAQDESPSKRTKWMNDLRDFKCEFLTKEVQLSKEQQNEFLPLYNEMEKEIYKTNKDAREYEKKITNSKTEISDLEYEKAAEVLWEVKQKEAQIESDYYAKFSKILSKKQLFLLKRAETRFAKSMLNHHKGSRITNNNQ